MTAACWIVGNGPSLNVIDLDKLAGAPAFATGRIALLYPRTVWRARYYAAFSTAVADPRFPEYAESAKEAMREASVTFAGIEYRDCPAFDAAGHAVWLTISETEHIEPEDARDDFWSDDPTRRVSKFGTSLLPAAQIAAWMGYRRLYFIGCDLGPGHFDPAYHPARLEQRWSDAALVRSHEIIRANCRRLGIEVYNATPGGALAVYPRADWRELVG